MERRKLFLVSNMYPCKKHIRYGVFVKNFEKAIEIDYDVNRTVLTKKIGFISKLFGYAHLYFNILALVFKAKKNNIIYVHFPLHMAPALWFVLFFRKKIILNFHGSDLIFNNFFTKFLSFFLNSIVRKCFIVVPSNFYKSKVIKLYSVNPNMVFVYPSGGINTSIFCPIAIPENDKFTLGFVSNFIEGKGWNIFLLAVESILLDSCVKNIEILMIGEGPDRQKIEGLLEKINVSYKIIPSVSQQELALYYNSFSLFIFPTYRESLGLVGLEAMACGTTVIAGKVGGPMSYIDDGINSYLFKKRNKDDLKRKIMQYYNLSNLEKEKIRMNGIETAKLYDHKIVNKHLLSFLKGV